MVVNYKGFEIDVSREKYAAGYDLVYRNVFRTEDEYHFGQISLIVLILFVNILKI